MSVVRFFKPENRLAQIVTAPGGKHVTTAVDDANEQLLEISGVCLKEVDDALARIFGAATGVPEGAQLRDLYRAVREIAGLAAVCALPDLGAAALSFCVLLDQAQDGGRLTEEHMRVSLNVLRLLRHPEVVNEEARRSLLENLDAMVAKSSPKDAPTTE